MVGLYHHLIRVIHLRSLRRETIDRRIINSPTTDRILMFEYSRVVETGSFDELLQAGVLSLRTRGATSVSAPEIYWTSDTAANNAASVKAKGCRKRVRI